MNNKSQLIEKDNKFLIELFISNISELNDKIKFVEEKRENKINEIENRIEKLEGFHKEKIQSVHDNFKIIMSKKVHNNYIMSMGVFPSGNIISVSKDKSIHIYDNNLNILQDIQNAHEDLICYIDIKDENNFVTCSNDKNIKTWIKKEDKFEINQLIKNAHKVKKIVFI